MLKGSIVLQKLHPYLKFDLGRKSSNTDSQRLADQKRSYAEQASKQWRRLHRDRPQATLVRNPNDIRDLTGMQDAYPEQTSLAKKSTVT